jgi:ankyrin repeat protein
MWAAGQGHADTVKLLLAKGAQKQLKDDRGLSAADMAKDAGHKAVADLLQ